MRVQAGWLAGIVVGLALSGAAVCPKESAGGVAAGPAETLMLEDGRLTARVVDASLRDVMAEIGRLTGAQVSWLPSADEDRVSVVVPGLPISEALRRILGERTFVLFYAGVGPEERLTRIWITSDPGARTSHASPAPEAATPPTREQPEVDGPPPIDLAVQAALTGDDIDARLHAIESLGPHVGANRAVRTALSRVARTDPNPQVRDVASAMLGRSARRR